MKKSLLLTLLLLVHVCAAWAADKVITGNVIADDDKQPLIGVSVYVSADDLKKAGSSLMSLGVVTDIDGNFSITVPSGVKKLQLSYIGYTTQQIELKSGQTHYNVALQPSSTMLNDVVVTGYQTVERRKLTAAVAKIDISEGRIGTVKSIDQALSGQIAGLSAVSTSGAPGSPVKIRIRGTSSLNGTQDPLWVLDGIPLEGTDVPQSNVLNDVSNIQQSSIAGLNPADIENITVLKDAAATAIYGARAANGVIVITTKKGKVGKPVINFSSKFTYMPTLSTNRLNMLNSQEKVDLELELLRSNFAYGDNKGGVSKIISGYGLTDAYKKGGWSALTPEAQTDISRMHQIAQVCKSKGITLYLVMPPVHPTYFQLMNQEQLTLIHNAITEVTNKWENVHSLEYFGDTRFNDEDFYDGNHLSSDIGAIKFTKILKDDILTDL